MYSCTYRHVLSIISSLGSVELFPHNIYGRYSPAVARKLDRDPKEISESIETGINEGKLRLKPTYSTPKCPSCGSPDPVVRISCPRCGSPFVVFSGETFRCSSCGLTGSAIEALSFMCRTCGSVYSLSGSALTSLGSVEPVAPDDYLERIAEVLEGAGVEHRRCAEVRGVSGVLHVFDFYFELNGKRYAIDVFRDEEAVDVRELMKDLVKAYDLRIDMMYFLAVPRLSVNLDPNVRYFKVIEGRPEEALNVLKQSLEIVIKK
ncbi:MAG: hypothetical protein ACP5LW_05660 [Nitrososphaeria archaeon]